MHFSIWTLFFTMLIGAFCGSDCGTCTSFKGSRYLPVPGKIDGNSVCGKLFSNSSCCSNETVGHIENKESQILNLRKVIQVISKECETALMHYACLFECSPELGQVHKITNPLKDVPICKSSCEWLYEKCKTDLTCTDDWGKDFHSPDFNCNNDDRNAPAESIWRKVGPEGNFCSMIKEAGIAKIMTSNDVCFDVTTGKYNKGIQGGSYHLFTILGLTVIAIVIVLALFYVGIYFIKKHRLSRGI